jgi:hypothetical protein
MSIAGQVVGGKVLRRISDLEDLDGPSAATASRPAIVRPAIYSQAFPAAGRPIAGGLMYGGAPGYPMPVGLGYSTTIAPAMRAPVSLSGPLPMSMPMYGGVYRR